MLDSSQGFEKLYPIELAEYAKSRSIKNESALSWLVPYTLRKRDVILSSVEKRVTRATKKYGIEIPMDASHAHRIDLNNNNTTWRDSIALEMRNKMELRLKYWKKQNRLLQDGTR